MKTHILPAVKLTAILIIFFAVIYPVSVWAIAQLSPNQGKSEIIESNGKNTTPILDKLFTEDQYFWSRPSAVSYNAAGSGGSNKAPSNEEYLEEVESRIDTFLIKNPGIQRSEIPVDLVTASGSGLDPDISVRAAEVQVKRIAQSRNMKEAELIELIEKQTEKPLFGLFGPEKINVLKLNIALDKLHN